MIAEKKRVAPRDPARLAAAPKLRRAKPSAKTRVQADKDQLGQIFGVAEQLGRTASAIASLAVQPAHRRLSDHSHTNPYLSLHVLGAYREIGDDGETLIGGP